MLAREISRDAAIKVEKLRESMRDYEYFNKFNPMQQNKPQIIYQ